MTTSRFISAALTGAITGLVVLTVYLVMERVITERISAMTCLEQLLQWDASNAYGARAFSGGWSMAWRGLGMDFVVALFWAIVFTLLYGTLPFVRRYPVPSGFFFGVIVMFVMIFWIVPLGHAIPMARTVPHLVNVFVAHTFFFGVPLAMAVDGALTGARFRR